MRFHFLSSMIARTKPNAPTPNVSTSIPELHNCKRIANSKIATPLFFDILSMLLFFSQKLQKSFVVHPLIGQVPAVIKKCVGSDRRRSILRLLLIFNMNGFERHRSFLCNRFDYGNIFRIEGTLAGIIQYIAQLLNVCMLCTYSIRYACQSHGWREPHFRQFLSCLPQKRGSYASYRWHPAWDCRSKS